MYLLLVLLWCCCIAVGCAVATAAALVHEETEEATIMKNILIRTCRENENTEVQKKCRNQRKAGKVQQAIDGGGVEVGTRERPGKSILRVPVQQSLAFYFRTVYSLQAVLSTDVQEQQYSSSFDHNTVLRAATAVHYCTELLILQSRQSIITSHWYSMTREYQAF